MMTRLFAVLLISATLSCGSGTNNGGSTSGGTGTTGATSGGGATGSTTSSTAGSTTGSNTMTATIKMLDIQFAPQTLTIAAGTTVTFDNTDSTAHDVASGPGSPDTFDLKNLPVGSSYTYTFNVKGSIPVICTYHSNMSLTITVQ